MSCRLFSCIVLAFVFVAGACGGGRTITDRQLATIMPSAADAPAGTQLVTNQSGPKTLDEFVTSQDVKTKLRSLGFMVAYVARFASPNFPSDPSQAKPGAVLYGTFGVLLRDGSAAHDGFSFYQSRARARAKDVTAIVASGFGEDSLVFRFSSLDNVPLPGVAYLWRVDNALFSVVGTGNPDANPQAARAIARLIDDRAKRP